MGSLFAKVVRGDARDQGRNLLVPSSGRWVLFGKSDLAHYKFYDSAVENRQLSIRVRDNPLVIELDSMNSVAGVRVNGQLKKSARVQPDDHISFAATELVLVYESKEDQIVAMVCPDPECGLDYGAGGRALRCIFHDKLLVPKPRPKLPTAPEQHQSHDIPPVPPPEESGNGEPPREVIEPLGGPTVPHVAEPTAPNASVHDPDDSSERDLIGGRFRIIEPLGRGSFGATFLCYDENLRTDAVVKFLHPHQWNNESVRRFDDEATMLARLHHTNIVGVIAHGRTSEGIPYLAMKRAAGKPLSHRSPLPEPVVRELGAQLCDALAAAHQQRIVHRDLKPDNLIVDFNRPGKPLLMVIDFGIASISRGSTVAVDSQSLKGGSSVIAGTFEYMSPEQARGDVVTTASDIYSAGVVLYQLLSDRLPAGRKPPFWDYSSLLHYVSLPSIPVRRVAPKVSADMEAILVRAYAKNPRDRFRDAEAMASALRGLSLWAKIWRKIRPIIAWTSVALILALIAGAALWWMSYRAPPEIETFSAETNPIKPDTRPVLNVKFGPGDATGEISLSTNPLMRPCGATPIVAGPPRSFTCDPVRSDTTYKLSARRPSNSLSSGEVTVKVALGITTFRAPTPLNGGAQPEFSVDFGPSAATGYISLAGNSEVRPCGASIPSGLSTGIKCDPILSDTEYVLKATLGRTSAEQRFWVQVKQQQAAPIAAKCPTPEYSVKEIPPDSTEGVLTVVVNPNATVQIDGCPMSLENEAVLHSFEVLLPPGNHTIKANSKGNWSRQETIPLAKRERREWRWPRK
jgi:serine/threonine-protein kinase